MNVHATTFTVLANPLPETIRGLPLHVLLVHAVVVLVPSAAAGTLLCALWPSVRRYFGGLVVLVAAAAAFLVPLATGSGENFQRQLGAQQLVHDHAEWGRRLIPCMVIVLLSAVLLVGLDIARRTAPDPAPATGEALSSGGTLTAVRSRPQVGSRTVVDRWVGARLPKLLRTGVAALWFRRLELVVTVVAVVAALVTLYVVFQTGESGARAAWAGR